MKEHPNETDKATQKSSRLCTASMIFGMIADVLFLLIANQSSAFVRTVRKLLGGFNSNIPLSSCVIGGISTAEEIFLYAFCFIFLAMLICALTGFVLAACSLIAKRPKKKRAVIGLVCNGIILFLFLLGSFVTFSQAASHSFL